MPQVITHRLAVTSAAPNDGRPRDENGRKLRARSLGNAKTAKASEIVHLRLLGEDIEPYERPVTRADCADIPRPCPYVGCKHHLYLDVNRDTGNIRVNFPDRDPDKMPANGSCVLDITDEGSVTLEQAGAYINLTRERIRQVEAAGLDKLRNPRLSEDGAQARVLHSFAGHQSSHGQSPLAEEMSESTTGEEDTNDDVRAHVPELPHIGDSSVSDEQYATAIVNIWAHWKRDRDAEASGELNVVAGRYVSDRHVRAMNAIRASWKTKKRAPSLMEIADAIDATGRTPASRRQNASSVMRSLRELGLVSGRRQQLRVVENPLPLSALPATTIADVDAIEEPEEDDGE
jgi:hypothetical protein